MRRCGRSASIQPRKIDEATGARRIAWLETRLTEISTLNAALASAASAIDRDPRAIRPPIGHLLEHGGEIGAQVVADIRVFQIEADNTAHCVCPSGNALIVETYYLFETTSAKGKKFKFS